MSKQYLTTHTIDNAHPTDIFSLAATPTTLISASGSSKILVHSTTDPSYPLQQTLSAHKLGCHHISLSSTSNVLASAGFEGDIKIWVASNSSPGEFGLFSTIAYSSSIGEAWALALNEDGSYLAATTYDGRILVWDVSKEQPRKVQEYETKGSFGLSVALSTDGRFTASGHENGGIYVFNNDSGRMVHSLPSLTKPVRTIAFSPAGTRLAAAGDSRIIALFDTVHGEQVSNLTGHAAWIFSLDWNDTGAYLLSGSFDGKTKVWSIDTGLCVATHTETEKSIWSVKWLPKTGKSEGFATAGANKSISFYREATGG